MSGSMPVTFSFCVGDLSSRALPVIASGAQQADRQVAKALAQIDRRRRGTGCRHCRAPRRSLPVAPVRANSRNTPSDNMNSCSGLT